MKTVDTKQDWPGAKVVYYVHAFFLLGLGMALLASPPWSFSPTWSYFTWLPHNGVGMGTTCTALGVLQLVALSRNMFRSMVVLMFLGGFTNWTAGILIFAEGVWSRQALVEAYWMCAIGGVKFITSMVLFDGLRSRRNDDQ